MFRSILFLHWRHLNSFIYRNRQDKVHSGRNLCFLLIVNGILNYALIFGKWGLPSMGIAGSALASTIAEAFGAVIFLLYLYFDKNVKELRIFSRPKLEFKLIKDQFKLAAPIVAQNFCRTRKLVCIFGL
ncbi:MAG: polysaccharide biosynthesis C-terminal domain-containing protein [Saprospiraceae bacterium]|nr:polysaccharide biosynthesis C-terminal domain-containing protein [Candidatus Brachybacter algidus]